jgi:AcrR family transcriptional regulator
VAPTVEPAQAPLPRGRHAASRETVALSQRQRLLEAIAAEVAEKGYGYTSVADVIARAGVSRKTFYELFDHRQDCFLQSYDHSVAHVLAAIDSALSGERDPFAAAAAGTRAYLAFLAANPLAARTFLIEVLSAGPAALARRAAVHERFSGQLREVYELGRRAFAQLPELPEHRFRACVGATDELVCEHVRVHGPERLESLLEPILDSQIGLLVGHDTAARLRSGSRPSMTA